MSKRWRYTLDIAYFVELSVYWFRVKKIILQTLHKRVEGWKGWSITTQHLHLFDMEY